MTDAPPAGSSTTLDIDRCAFDDLGTAAIELIRRQLKLDKRTKPGMLAAAIDLACDATLLATKACDDRNLPAGSHTRARALADRILADGILPRTCTPGDAPQAPMPEVGLSESLLVQQRWVADHAPNLQELTASPLVFSTDGSAATRRVFARIDSNQQEPLCSTVSYDVPTTSSERKRFADRHRRREEAAIRELDVAAAAVHRAKRARLQKGLLREQRQDVDEEKVLWSVLERCISQLEREADAERRRTDCVQRLSIAGYPNVDRAHLQIGDLIYVASDSPAPYVRFVQLAVLRRVHRSGCKVDVQLCEVSPPEMGTIGVDRVRLAAWL